MPPIFDAAWTVEQVMKTYPQTVSVFIAWKTDCVGCSLERFCTLEEVAQTYKLPLDAFLKDLNDVIQS